MKQLTRKILKATSGPEGDWENFRLLKNEILLEENKKELIIDILNTKEFIYTDVGGLFLTIPELWEDFDLNDWLHIIRNVNRPSKYRLYMDYEPNFEDIRFLYNWIGIDSVSLYKEDSEISKENKENLNKVFPQFLNDTMRNGDTYKEDFKDGTFGDISFFRIMKERLISQGAKESFNGNL
ncbi:hypothetical protein DZC78_10085 [Olleya aquimaris]|nr:hypothetical protein DZC78_10085 [Olleya aquimaris]